MNLTAENTARRPVVDPDEFGMVRMWVSPSEVEIGDRVLTIEQRDIWSTDFWVEEARTHSDSTILVGSRVVGARDRIEVERRVPWVARPRGGAL